MSQNDTKSAKVDETVKVIGDFLGKGFLQGPQSQPLPAIPSNQFQNQISPPRSGTDIAAMLSAARPQEMMGGV